jgi:mannosyltransferase OCH1-like enzyme
MEWNEDVFNIASVPYVKQAYEARKYAFVSDYVRLYALYHYGGIYMDTDVEVIQSLDRFLTHEAFSGFEDEVYLQSGTMGAVKEHAWIKELLEYYADKQFTRPDGTYDMTTNTNIITRICSKWGLVANGQYQVLQNGVVFYPRTYFSPYDYINGESFRTEDSYTIHHFIQSWLPAHVRVRGFFKRIVSRIIGPKGISLMRKVLQNR